MRGGITRTVTPFSTHRHQNRSTSFQVVGTMQRKVQGLFRASYLARRTVGVGCTMLQVSMRHFTGRARYPRPNLQYLQVTPKSWLCERNERSTGRPMSVAKLYLATSIEQIIVNLVKHSDLINSTFGGLKALGSRCPFLCEWYDCNKRCHTLSEGKWSNNEYCGKKKRLL